jgi:O-acetyl-ADP-ribose deacetylase (regulator of RNase III)
VNIQYTTGDATKPVGEEPRIIVHVCNDVGGWGKGFVLALSRRWPEPEKRYRAWYQGKETLPFKLGQVQFVPVEQGLWVANLIGQHDVRVRNGVSPVRYEAIRQGLQRVANFAHQADASVHMPRIGSGLAGGKWEEIRQIVKEELADKGIAVTVYDLPK